MRHLILSLLLLFTLPLAPACGHNPGPVVAQATIDCLGKERALIGEVFAALKAEILAGRADWGAIYQQAKGRGPVVGGCVIAKLVQWYLGGNAAPGTDDGWAAHQALEQFRREEAGGATFVTAEGKL